MKFTEISKLKRHINQVHTSKDKKCTKCEKTFKLDSNRKIHERSVHNGERPFSCKICSKKFTDPGAAKRHEITIHEKLKKHKCNMCSKTFSLVSYLNSHIKWKHQKGTLLYKCDPCNKFYVLKGHLKIHNETIHQKIRFKCDICEQEYSRPHSLKNH